MRKRPNLWVPKHLQSGTHFHLSLSDNTLMSHDSVVCLFKQSYTPHSLSKSCKAILHDKQTYYYYQRCCRVGLCGTSVCEILSHTYYFLSFSRKRKGKERKERQKPAVLDCWFSFTFSLQKKLRIKCLQVREKRKNNKKAIVLF